VKSNVNDDRWRLARILEQISDSDDREWLIELVEPLWRRRRRRLDERNQRVREEAIEYFAGGFVASARAIAGLIARDLGRYACTAYRFERDGGPPADLRRRRLWMILQLNNHRPMSVSSVRDALAGVGGQKSPGAFVHRGG
jgi:hypothetical protein